ncbi:MULTISPECIES: vitamin K epoxide reductase family protein [Chitinophagaceae]
MRMTLLIQRLLNPLGNSEAVTIQLCRALAVSVTATTIRKQLEVHPDYPSLMSISDVLKNIGINNISPKNTTVKTDAFETPFIAQISLVIEGVKSRYFCVITKNDDEQISFIHPIELKETTLSLFEFEKICTKNVLLIEKSETSGEKEYTKHLKEEKRIILTKFLCIAAIPILTLIACIICFINFGVSSVSSIVYTLVTLAGAIFGTLLLWYEMDKHNPALQQICVGGKKTNCDAILSSDASKIFGISWSVIGLTYFAGSLISMLVTGVYNIPNLSILAWLNVLALPYIIFSLYYQSKIAKQWCVFCLATQAILVLQFIVALLGGFHLAARFHISDIFTIFVSFTIFFLILCLLLPALNKEKENKQNKHKLQKLKHDPQIFQTLIAKQKIITESTDGLGIVLGNPNAPHKLIKVCNPYCGPCSEAHSEIEYLMENNTDIQIQIIFTATDDDNDLSTHPVKHLLAIAAKNNEQETKKALNDWYLADKKDYETFAVKYPMSDDLKLQSEKVKAMSEWVNITEIAFTPTFFINGYQLPEQYSVADLKYFLSI